MKELHKFERDFIRRTLRIVDDYAGPYDATLLLNCLLGLLVVPRETLIDHIPREPFSTGDNVWGIARASVKSPGRPTHNNPQPETVRGLVRSLRDAVAHFRVHPIQGGGQVTGFSFSTDSGFLAEVPLAELRAFATRLAAHVEDDVGAE